MGTRPPRPLRSLRPTCWPALHPALPLPRASSSHQPLGGTGVTQVAGSRAGPCNRPSHWEWPGAFRGRNNDGPGPPYHIHDLVLWPMLEEAGGGGGVGGAACVLCCFSGATGQGYPSLGDLPSRPLSLYSAKQIRQTHVMLSPS